MPFASDTAEHGSELEESTVCAPEGSIGPSFLCITCAPHSVSEKRARGTGGSGFWRPRQKVAASRQDHLFVYRPHPPPSARVKPGAPQPRSLRRSAAIFPPPPFSGDANRQLPPHLSIPFPHGTLDPNRPPPLNGRRGRGWERAGRKSERPKAAAAPPQRAPPSRRGAGPAAALPGRRCPAAPGKEPPGQRGRRRIGPRCPSHTQTRTQSVRRLPVPRAGGLLTVRAVAGTCSGPAYWLLPAGRTGGARGGSGRYGGRAAAGAMGRAGGGHVTGTSRGARGGRGRGRGKEPVSRDRGTGRHGASPAVTWGGPAPPSRPPSRSRDDPSPVAMTVAGGGGRDGPVNGAAAPPPPPRRARPSPFPAVTRPCGPQAPLVPRHRPRRPGCSAPRSAAPPPPRCGGGASPRQRPAAGGGAARQRHVARAGGRA